MSQTKQQTKSAKELAKLRIRIQAYDPKLLDKCVKQIIDISDRFDIKFVGPVPLPTKIKKYTVNRASFVFSRSKEQFEMRTHTRILDMLKPSQNVVEALSGLSLPSGVSVEAQMVS